MSQQMSRNGGTPFVYTELLASRQHFFGIAQAFAIPGVEGLAVRRTPILLVPRQLTIEYIRPFKREPKAAMFLTSSRYTSSRYTLTKHDLF
jgi:hypothetical protein